MMATAATTGTKKMKCKYWAKCYRKDAAHIKNFLHPGDEEDDIPSPGKAVTKKFDLQGKRVVFSGNFTNSTKKDLERKAKLFGCFVGSTLAKNIDLVVTGEDADEVINKAQKLGVRVYSEEEWGNLLKQAKPNKEAKESEEADDASTSAKNKSPESKLRKRRTHDVSDNEDSQGTDPKVSVKETVKETDGGETSDTDIDDETKPSPPKKPKTENDKADEEEAGTSGTVPKLTRSRSKTMSKKPKCKFWAKCYRKNDDHLRDFLHPHDIVSDGSSSGDLLVQSADLPKNMDMEFEEDADASTPLPLHMMKDGERVNIKGGMRGEYTYSIKRVADTYSCDCVAWKTQSKPVEKRTCRHLKNYLGEDFELFRVGKMTGNASDEVITRAARHKSIGSLMLAHKWTDKVSPIGWWMSEKLDGVRAFWDGKTFYSRLGNEFIAPSWFTKGFPADMTLDGELFGGRGKFQSTVSIVKTAGSGRWSEIKYYIFDAPNIKKPFEERLEVIHDYFDSKKVKTVTVLEHVKCKGEDHLTAELKKVEALGGEGLMIRKPKSPYEHRRSDCLLKIKTFHDAEAVVIGYEKGKGRNASVMGAVVCRMECGKTFKVGTGFTDAQRRSPPKKGSIITYRFQEYTNSGSPRFPSYVGIRIDMDGPKDAVLPKKGDD